MLLLLKISYKDFEIFFSFAKTYKCIWRINDFKTDFLTVMFDVCFSGEVRLIRFFSTSKIFADVPITDEIILYRNASSLYRWWSILLFCLSKRMCVRPWNKRRERPQSSRDPVYKRQGWEGLQVQQQFNWRHTLLINTMKMKSFLVCSIFILLLNCFVSCASQVIKDANSPRPQLHNRLQGKEIRVVAGNVRIG